MMSARRLFLSSSIIISSFLSACASQPTASPETSSQQASVQVTAPVNEPMPAAAPKFNYHFYIKMQCAVESGSFLAIPVTDKAVSWRYGSQTGVAKSDEGGILDIVFSSDTEETAKVVLVKYLARTYKVPLAEGPMVLPISSKECLK